VCYGGVLGFTKCGNRKDKEQEQETVFHMVLN
jgi:hypothetical protein